MRGTLQDKQFQIEWVKQNYGRAVREGNTKLANDIKKANPDLNFTAKN